MVHHDYHGDVHSPATTVSVPSDGKITLEIIPPEPGLELSGPDRPPLSPPGLEAVSGPVLVASGDYGKSPLYSSNTGSVATGPTSNSALRTADSSDPEKRERARICGLRRRAFWLVLSGSILLVVVAVVLGAVLGSRSRSDGTSVAAPGATVASSKPSTATSTSQTPSPVPTTCPSADGKTYTDASNTQFKIECSKAYQNEDLRHVEAGTLGECATFCAKESACVAAVYFAGTQGDLLNFCWMKTGLGDVVYENPDAIAIVRL